MPSLMTLQGPGLGRSLFSRFRARDGCCDNCTCGQAGICPDCYGSSGQFRRASLHGPLAGVGNAIMLQPLAAIAGLVLGGYLAYKNVRPFAALKRSVAAHAWGEQRMTHARTKALSGRRR